MAEEWLTYAQMGERLGLSTEAARQKAKRLGLRRQTANDGKAQVLVDVEDVRTTTPPRKEKEPEQQAEDPPVDPRLWEALDAHIASLKELLAREQARADGLQARLDAMADDRANIGRRTGELEQALAEIRDQHRAYTARPWWQRLAG